MKPLKFAQPIIPVLSIDDVNAAKHAVAAMQQGGLTCVEVALRSENALNVLSELVAEFPELTIGAGTLKEPADFSKVQAAGAQFAVSPGATPELMQESKRWELPYLPAAATVSEILALAQFGVKTVKLFPAQTLGGVQYLKDISAPLGDIDFVPSGGVSLDNFLEYLALDCVNAVSGTWMLKKADVIDGNWAAITRISAQTLQMLDQ